MRGVILFGDSIFDNAPYLEPGEKDVAAQLAAKLAGRDWTVELRAADGATTRDVHDQIKQKAISIPSILVLSAGGNDALANIDWLADQERNRSPVDILNAFSEIQGAFRRDYRATLDRLTGFGPPVVVCTIYNPKFPDPAYNRLAATALSLFNDVITEEALRRDLAIVDLRAVCAEAACFANPIEPSELGGARIADAIIERLER